MLKPVDITGPALIEIREILTKKGIPDDYALRLGVGGGSGCTGTNYVLGFDKKKDNDLTYDIEGIPVLIQKSELMFLIGKKIDFFDSEEARGFVFLDEDQPDISTEAR